MTESVSGSSLLQARDVHSTHNRPSQHHIRSHGHAALHKRQEAGQDTSVVQVIQTIQVVQIVDQGGATLTEHTSISEATTTPAAVAETEPTLAALNDPAAVTTTTGLGENVAETLPTIIPTTVPSIDPTALPSMSPTFPTIDSFSPITSGAPLPASSGFPSLNGVTNSTASSSSLFSNGTVSVNFFNQTTSTVPISSGTVLYNSSLTSTLDSSGASSTAASSTASDPFGSATTTSTGGAFFGGIGGTGSGNGGATGSASPSGSSTTGDGSSTSKEAQTTVIAGSVLGAVAGVAMILVAALMLLRWKKRRDALKLRASDTGGRGLLTAGSASGAPQGMSDMAERRSIPFAVPAALANLTGYKRFSHRQVGPADGERGFQKLAGRKLPSVLQHGGDGFSEPSFARDSIMSDQSAYRDSIGMFGGPSMPRVAVGSPMRPESGVPIFHAGPARTPVTEQGHFSPVQSPERSDSPTLVPPPHQRDAFGRSLTSRDGSTHSQGSASRFSEHI